jgi:hypothetical protein
VAHRHPAIGERQAARCPALHVSRQGSAPRRRYAGARRLTPFAQRWAAHPLELKPLLAREAFFRDLYSKTPVGVTDRAHLLGRAGAVGDVNLEVVELTGAPGDAYFTDLRVLHSGSPNTAALPRIMATYRFVCAEVIEELTAGYDWK